MKNLLLILAIFIISKTNAQDKVQASDIINKINAGTNVSLQNVTITGVLDLTKISTMKLRHKEFANKEYVSTVNCELAFVNCTFADDFLAAGTDTPPVGRR